LADEAENLELDEPTVGGEADTGDVEEGRGRSLRDTITRAMDRHREPATPPDRDDKPQPQPKDTADKPARERDASGKFTRAETAPSATGKEPEAKPAATPVTPTATGEAPKSWTKDAQAQWNSLPQWARDQIAKRENDMAAGAAQLRQRYGAIHETTQRAEPMFQRHGLDANQGIDRIVQWFEAIERNPQVGIAELAKAYRVNLNATGPTPTAQPGATPTPNPTQAQPSDPRIDQILQRLGQYDRAEQTRQQSATNESLKAWSANKPHFEAVRNVMGLIVAGAAQRKDDTLLKPDGQWDLDRIYDMATGAVPDVRAAMEREAAEARAADRKAKAEEARRRASSVRPGAPGSAGPAGHNSGKPPKGASVRDSIKSAIEELRS